jgi:hypothetical protein
MSATARLATTRQETRGDGGNMAGGGEAGNGSCEAVNATSWNGFAVVEDRAGAPAELSMSHDEWGRFTLRFSAPADLGALVAAALKEAKDALFGAGRPEVTWADALSEIAGRSLGTVESVNRRDAFRTYVHLDTDGGWLTGRPRLPKHLSDRLTCDEVLQPLWLTGGAPVNVGRAQRIVPTRTRRLVEDRDRGCRFPGCNATAHVECHHVIHWADGGLTDTPNLACLCPYHHDAHHGGEFIVTGDADNPRGLTFTTRRGLPISLGPTFNTPTHPASTDPAPTDPTPSFTDPNFTDRPPGSACSAPTITITDPDFADRPRGSAWPATTETVTAPATTAYRGPTGETLHLRHVSFHESPTPAPS